MEKENCTGCGEDINMTGFACISSTFEQHEDGDFIFYASAGYDEQKAREFVIDVRLGGKFGVMMKVEDIPKGKLTFTNLLQADITL